MGEPLTALRIRLIEMSRPIDRRLTIFNDGILSPHSIALTIDRDMPDLSASTCWESPAFSLRFLILDMVR